MYTAKRIANIHNGILYEHIQTHLGFDIHFLIRFSFVKYDDNRIPKDMLTNPFVFFFTIKGFIIYVLLKYVYHEDVCVFFFISGILQIKLYFYLHT